MQAYCITRGTDRHPPELHMGLEFTIDVRVHVV